MNKLRLETFSRASKQGAQNYRNGGSSYEESQVVRVEGQCDERGAIARSCLMYKQYAGATVDGIYSIKIQDLDVSVSTWSGGASALLARRGF